MAVPLVQINDKVRLPDGSTAAGTIEAELSGPAFVLDGASSVEVAGHVSGTIAADGTVTLSLVPNDAMTPSGRFYLVTQRFGAAVVRETWQVASAPSPVNIGAVPRLGVVPGVALGVAVGNGDLSAGLVTATGSTVANALKDWLLDPVYVRGFLPAGFVSDGSVDYSAAILAATTYAMGAAGGGRGGTLVFPAGTFRMDSQWVMPNDGGSPPKQPNLLILGQGGGLDGQGNPPKGGTILDLRYSGAVAKIDTRGLGILGLSRVTLATLAGNDGTPFIQTTNTTLLVDATVGIYGNTNLTGTQDAIVLGGTTTSIDGSATGAFQGYGTSIIGAHFNRIRRAVYGRTYCNSVTITHNKVWAQSGFATGAAFDLDGLAGAGAQATGNVVAFNLIEMVGYKYGIRIGYGLANSLTNNNFWDPTATTTAYYRLDTGALNTLIVDGWHATSKPTLSDVNPTGSVTTLISGISAVQWQIQNGGYGALFDGPITIQNGNPAGYSLKNNSNDEARWSLTAGANGGPDLTYNPAGGGAEFIASFKRQGVNGARMVLNGSALSAVDSSAGDLKIRALGNSTLWLGDTFATPFYVQASTKTLVLNDALAMLRFGSSNGPAILFGTAAPTTGTWKLGDRVINSSPAVGQPKAWACTVAGTPGTWVSEGNL